MGRAVGGSKTAATMKAARPGRAHRQAKKQGLTWAVDIETETWDQFVLGFAKSSEGHRVALDTHASMWDWYASLDPVDLVIGHNAGRFDYLALIDSNRDAKWTGTLAGTGLVSLRAEGGAECRDSSRVFPMALADWTGRKESTGLPCIGTTLDCRKEGGCGGYCSVRRDMSPAMRARLMGYCENDTDILLEKWQEDIARLEMEGFDVRSKHGDLRRTVGGIAHATAIRLGDLPKVALDWTEYTRGLTGYYGGHVEAACTRSDAEGRGFDINQAYPWALTLPVPDGVPTYLNTAREATHSLATQRPGIYTARIRLPDGRLPLLPHRSPKGRLLWANGEIEGDWTHIEIDQAVRRGAVIREIRRAMVYPNERVKYGDYMHHVFDRRDAAKEKHKELCAELGTHPDDTWTKEKSWSVMVKFLGNALSGKLAQQPGVARLIIADMPPPPDERKGTWDPLGRRAWVQTVRPHPPVCARPAEAAVLTSRVRDLFNGAALALDEWWYGDTDGIKGVGTLPPEMVGKGLGMFKDEGPVRRWRCKGPKLYSYIGDATPKNPTGIVVRMKGFPRADEDTYERAVAGEAIAIDRGVKGIRSALRDDDHAFVRKDFARQLRSDPRVAGSRLLLPDGFTVPLHRSIDGVYSWPVRDAPNPEDILKISKRKPTDVWTAIMSMIEGKKRK